MRNLGRLGAGLALLAAFAGTGVVSGGEAAADPCGHWRKETIFTIDHYYTHCGPTRVWVNINDQKVGMRPSTCFDAWETRYIGKLVTYAHSTGAPC